MIIVTRGGFYNVLEWIMWLIYLNALWVFFTIIGLGLFGFFPATVSMFTIIRQLLLKEEKSIFKTFLLTYKQEFFKANGIGLILAVIAYVLYMDLLFLDAIQGILYNLFQIGLIFISIIFLITVIYIFPVYVHFNLKFFQNFKHAFLIGIFSPLANLAIIIGFALLYYIYKWIPGLIPAFGLGLVSLLITVSVMFAFTRFEKRQQKLNEPEGKPAND